jgi:hypothetical protein
MSAEIFRFVTVRPPQEAMDGDTQAFVELPSGESAFLDSLRMLRKTGTREQFVSAAAKFEATPHFVADAATLDRRLLEFARRLQALPAEGFWGAAGDAYQGSFDKPAAEVAAELSGLYADVGASIVAALIDSSVPPRARDLLVAAARALWLIDRIAGKAPVTRALFDNAPIVVPEGIFPLPPPEQNEKDRQEAAQESDDAVAARRRRIAQLTAELESRRKATDELVTALERGDDSMTSLSKSTRSLLDRLGTSGKHVDVARSVTLLEREASGLATQLYATTGTSGTMVRVGSSIISQDALHGGGVFADPGTGSDGRTPGPCPPTPIGELPESTVTVPAGHGDARILGIADLLVLEQELLRYQLGEIAHIENVLKSETRSRRFRTTDTTQQTQTTTTEVVEEKEQDLASTQRFELQTESQTVINQNASKETGLTIHASYGPSVDATANYNTTSGTSSSQSHSVSANYAKEITNKAVQRVQTRTMTSRTVTTFHEVEEIDKHGFDNRDGAADIVGVYRFVDKVYSAQIVNYGKRLMLEFVVPEPAAFLRYALTHKPIKNVTQVRPDPPGYCVAGGASFEPLKVSDIDREWYLYWASKYGAQDVSPPPPSVIAASGTIKSPDQMQTTSVDGNDTFLCSDTFDVSIPDGYLTQSAFINIYGETQAVSNKKIVVQIQDQQRSYVEPVDDLAAYTLHLQPTATLPISLNAVGFHNYEIIATVTCTLSLEKYQEWQLKTFNSIMAAYEDLKSSYDTAIEEAELQASDDAVTGSNPEVNRTTEQTELKRACISLLTGQRFELFDAMRRNIAPYGYPELDFGDARAEGTYIKAFEQSFEWNNLVYVLYPYFWGSKADWVTIAQLTDGDPQFAQFLQAGAARVQVPVRPGFENGILAYLSTGELWAGAGPVINGEGGGPDPQSFSIIDELKSQTGNNNVEGVGTLSVTHGETAVAGQDTEFTPADDERRRIIIGGATYLIASVSDADSITLATPFAGETAAGVGYALGGKLVGQPWEIRLPTDLIKLDSSLVIA